MHLRCCQNFRHVTLHNSPSQALGNRGFTHTSLTHQERVVFAAAAQHLNNPLHFLLTADQRINFPFLGQCIQILGVLVKRRLLVTHVLGGLGFLLLILVLGILGLRRRGLRRFGNAV